MILQDCVLATLWGVLNLLFLCRGGDGSGSRAASAVISA